jgi:glycosyltransferase involved in cell wall biosynthesis
MRVVIVSAVFPPEPMVSAQTSAQIAKELSQLGHSVHVFAPFPNRPKGYLYKGHIRQLYCTKISDDGYTLTSCFGTFSPSSTMLSRFAENLSFGTSSGLRILFGKRPDVIYSNTWPIFATGIVACIARLRSIPLVISVQDVYPESLESQDRTSRRRWFYRVLTRVDTAISHSAAQIIVISERFRQLHADDRGVEAERLHVIPNWGKEDFIATDISAVSVFRRRMGIPKDAFVAVYAGNVGVASNAEMLVDVFAQLANCPQVYLVIAGDGSRLGICREEITRKKLDRVLIHSPWKTEETAPVLQMADVLLLPTKGKQSLSSIPSKLISYLLSGRPVIAAVLPESDTATTILGTGAGWVVDPDSPDMIARSIAIASEQPREKLNQMGAAGREFALRNLTRDSTLPRVIGIILRAAGLRKEDEKSQQGANQCR